MEVRVIGSECLVVDKEDGKRIKRVCENRVEMGCFVLFEIEVIWIFVKKRRLES